MKLTTPGIKVLAFASIPTDRGIARIEKHVHDDSGAEHLRFTLQVEDETLPLCLTEAELVALLEVAIRKDVLSTEVIGGLQAITDI